MENNLKNIPDSELLKELQARGFVTFLILSSEDVDLNLERFNDDREEAEQVTLTEEDKNDILQSVIQTHGDYLCEQINDAIWYLIDSDYSK